MLDDNSKHGPRRSFPAHMSSMFSMLASIVPPEVRFWSWSCCVANTSEALTEPFVLAHHVTRLARTVIANQTLVTQIHHAMRTSPIVFAALVLGTMTGCVSTSTGTNHSRSSTHEATAEATSVVGPPFAQFAVPLAMSEGPERDVQVLVDAPHIKTMAIVLRRGTLLPTHNVRVPVIIQAMSGAGHVLIGDERVRIDAQHFVTVRPSVSHSVEPDAGTNLVLLVHQVRGGTRHDTSNSEHGHEHHETH